MGDSSRKQVLFAGFGVGARLLVRELLVEVGQVLAGARYLQTWAGPLS